MFHLTHAYIASKSVGDAPYVLFGAILPDIAFLRKDNFLEDKHSDVDYWIEKIEDKELIWGIATHKLTDEISHKNSDWDGPDKSFSRWCESNFPKYTSHTTLHLATEYMVELYVARTYPETIDNLDLALKKVDVHRLSKNLAPVFNEDSKKLAAMLKHYINLVHTNSRIAKRMNFIAKNADREACLELCISKCKSILKA